MELDDFKQAWQRADEKTTLKNENIMELILQKSYGPVAALKTGFRKQILVMLVVAFSLVLTNLDDVQKLFGNILFWCYILFLVAVCVFSYYNYQLVKKMEVMDGMVKANLEQQVSILETRLKWKIKGLRFVGLFFIGLCEVLPYVQHIRMLDKWHSLPVLARLGAYAAFLLFQYFVSRAVYYRKFGRHLEYLKGLAKQME
jgi:hypothetical protein